MAKADYHLCIVCDGTTFYDPNGGDEDEYYVALHHECLARLLEEASGTGGNGAMSDLVRGLDALRSQINDPISSFGELRDLADRLLVEGAQQ